MSLHFENTNFEKLHKVVCKIGANLELVSGVWKTDCETCGHQVKNILFFPVILF